MSINITLNINETDYQRLKQCAEQSNNVVNHLIEKLIIDYLEQNEEFDEDILLQNSLQTAREDVKNKRGRYIG